MSNQLEIRTLKQRARKLERAIKGLIAAMEPDALDGIANQLLRADMQRHAVVLGSMANRQRAAIKKATGLE